MLYFKGTISYEDYISLMKFEEKHPLPSEIDTSPTISEKYKAKINRDLGTNPH